MPAFHAPSYSLVCVTEIATEVIQARWAIGHGRDVRWGLQCLRDPHEPYCQACERVTFTPKAGKRFPASVRVRTRQG